MSTVLMDNLSYENIQEKIQRYVPRKDKELTAWIHSIQHAKCVILDPDDDWKDDETLIQVKQMSEANLAEQSSTGDDDDDDDDDSIHYERPHLYERYLDVIKLPTKIPIVTCTIIPQFLFVRPDEYDLMTLLGRDTKDSLLLGNLGIGKSWFHWKYIVFCCKPELFKQLWPSKAIMQQTKMVTENVETSEPSSKKANIATKTTDIPFIPKLIIYTMGGSKSYLFFTKGQYDVLYFNHQSTSLSTFAYSKSIVVLWETGSSMEPINNCRVQANIIATAPPDDTRQYKYFEKTAATFYMPCPSEIQLRLMGQIYRSVSSDIETQSQFSDTEICNRVRNIGSSIHVCFNWDRQHIFSFNGRQAGEIRALQMNKERLRTIVHTTIHVIMDTGGYFEPGLSHRLVQIHVNRDNVDRYFFLSLTYKVKSKKLLSLVCEYISQMEYALVRNYLIDSCKYGDQYLKPLLYLFLGRIFECNACSKYGLIWMYRQIQLNIPRPTLATSDVEYTPFQIKLMTSDRSNSITYNNMQHDVLYYPTDVSFPLVDIFYLDIDRNLVGIIATIISEYAKTVSAYNKFYSRLGTSPETTKLSLYYLILPNYANDWEQRDYSFSDFCYGINIPESITNNITFHVLVPPKSFASNSTN